MQSNTTPSRPLDRDRVHRISARELDRLNENTPASAALYERARKTLCKGVGSSYQCRDPWPIYIRDGKGSRIWDVDGHEYIDYLNGFGSMVQGHAHPAIVKAVQEQVLHGTQFSEPTEAGVAVAEDLSRRWKLPKWRFTNSGSESTMDAIRIARAVTGRDVVMKIFGSYHGHHDYVMVSVPGNYGDLGPRDAYSSLPYGAGIPQVVVDMTVPVPFNDADAMERRVESLAREGRLPACMIMEPAMMNIGVVLPEPAYLDQVRALTRKHGILLIFDEVKTGLTVAPGGGTEYFGVMPDLVTLAKSLGGGVPSGAIGGTEEVFEAVESDRVWQVGTFNGNPLAMAAARATLYEILTPEAYENLGTVRERISQGCRRVIDEYRLPAYPVAIGAKGCVTFSDIRVTDYESYVLHQDAQMMDLAWLYLANRGIFAAPGRDQEFTISVQHTLDDADRYVEVFDELAAELVA
jgi:glutamate-1-semialdehyde 2,1-aminomutase